MWQEQKEIWQKLKESKKPIWLYGMGNGADRVLSALNERAIHVEGVFASDGFVRHQSFQGYTVCSYEEAKARSGEMIVLICFGSSRDEVLLNIEKIAREQELYAPDVPVYGDGLFTLSFLQENRERLQRVYDRLADPLSKETFSSVLAYKVSGELPFLKWIEAKKEDTYKEILKLSSRERYVDIGAFIGDTVEEFLHYTESAEKIWAVEPDKRSFRKLAENTKELKNITLFYGAAGEKRGELEFRSNGGRGSSSGEGKRIPTISVDELTAGEKVSFIKIDAEGMEKQVLVGAQKTIKAFRPKLRVACYHRVEDLFSIAEQVFSIENDYQLYLRKYKGIPAWDMEYYFV